MCQYLAAVHIRELTSENAIPNCIATSKVLSIGLFISGEYSFNSPSSLWSVERKESAYGTLVTGWDGESQSDEQ